MTDYQKQLENILKNINILSGQKKDLTQQVLRHKEEISLLKSKLEKKEIELDELRNTVEGLKMSTFAPESEEERSELKKKLNEFIKEIDKSIGLLSD